LGKDIRAAALTRPSGQRMLRVRAGDYFAGNPAPRFSGCASN